MILDKQHILKIKKEYKRKKFRGIYFLIKEDKIVYVGSSTDIMSRIVTHKEIDKKKDFDSYSYILLEKHTIKEMHSLEVKYIRNMLPKLNRIKYKSITQSNP